MKVLDSSIWPLEPSIRHGKKENKYLAKRFQINEVNAVNGMREWLEADEKTVYQPN